MGQGYSYFTFRLFGRGTLKLPSIPWSPFPYTGPLLLVTLLYVYKGVAVRFFPMSTTIQPAALDLKADVHPSSTHLEAGDANAIDNAKATNFVIDNSHEVSRYAELTFFQTVKYFWRAMAISFACGICAMGDGYQYKMPGNIVALEGFIRQMGYKDVKTGEYALNSQQVAAWGGKSSMIK